MTAPDDDRGGTDGVGTDRVGTERFPVAIIPLALLVLVGIVAGLLLADRDDAGLTPGTTPAAVTTTSVDAGPVVPPTSGVTTVIVTTARG